MTPARFKRLIRDLQIWCSSCMIASSGGAPIGVLIGAKRRSATLVHTIAVHPDHRRQGHARHLLASLASKLAILGPPKIVVEAPETNHPLRALLDACGYVEEARLTDWVLDPPVTSSRNDRSESETSKPQDGTGADPSLPGDGPITEPSVRRDGSAMEVPGSAPERAIRSLAIPVTVDDLQANGLLGHDELDPPWERALVSLVARKAELQGIALATVETIEAYILLGRPDGSEQGGARAEGREILALRSLVPDEDGSRLRGLMALAVEEVQGPLRFPGAGPREVPASVLRAMGFRPVRTLRRCSMRALTPALPARTPVRETPKSARNPYLDAHVCLRERGIREKDSGMGERRSEDRNRLPGLLSSPGKRECGRAGPAGPGRSPSSPRRRAREGE
jgi:hypothetical protein